MASLVAAVRACYTALPEPYNLAPDPYAEALVGHLMGAGLSLISNENAADWARARGGSRSGMNQNVRRMEFRHGL